MKDNKQSSTLTMEEISKIWGLCLKTAIMMLAQTTHQNIRTTGLVSKYFRTDKSQLCYK